MAAEQLRTSEKNVREEPLTSLNVNYRVAAFIIRAEFRALTSLQTSPQWPPISIYLEYKSRGGGRPVGEELQGATNANQRQRSK